MITHFTINYINALSQFVSFERIGYDSLDAVINDLLMTA